MTPREPLFPDSPGTRRAAPTTPTVVPPPASAPPAPPALAVAADPIGEILDLEGRAARLHAEAEVHQLRADLLRNALDREGLIELLRRQVRRAAEAIEARRG